jgi:hypothetical protein
MRKNCANWARKERGPHSVRKQDGRDLVSGERTDMRSCVVQASWAMHAEALPWHDLRVPRKIVLARAGQIRFAARG